MWLGKRITAPQTKKKEKNRTVVMIHDASSLRDITTKIFPRNPAALGSVPLQLHLR